jgi:hypothetical protein
MIDLDYPITLVRCVSSFSFLSILAYLLALCVDAEIQRLIVDTGRRGRGVATTAMFPLL